MTPAGERRALQLAVALAGLVPVGAGLSGIWSGPSMAGEATTDGATLDSHFRYLSGLLLGVGIAFWSLVPRIAAHGPAFRLLTAIVVIGGAGRLVSLLAAGTPSPPMLAGLAMELVVTPLLCLWQAKVARFPSSRLPAAPCAGRSRPRR
ncbi:hypothetical protein STHU_01510 [Allostella humosa]|uniref:DUF4345 domain-containing protein n=1 Tax=Stella humosa TaxID=94 RepID=UPI0011394163|nr:DUF4345 domain-containing protein [Stella humosa]BBK29517.1 hypothetical protein STHU_01510 [Stella humosa]